MHLSVLLLALLSAVPSPMEGATASACERAAAADVYRVLDCEQSDAFLATAAAFDACDAEDDDDASDLRRRAVQAQPQHPTAETPAVATAFPTSLPGTGHARAACERPVARTRFHKEAIPRARAQLPDPAPVL
ncbi:MAG TPA: hypothetical protein VLA96_00995 [Terriglobales bacterium]|jgi:hypothetical protein|nr:hypothetical protein [Terriglobales bacterium]